jgi:hypothetical protein
MKKLTLTLAVSAATVLMSQAALADRVKGMAKADFKNDELQVPCVQIEGYGAGADGQFYDIVLKRRGKSFNYELILAEPEDTAVCEELENYAIFIDEDDDDDSASDDDFDHDSSDDDSDDDSSDDDADDDSSSTDAAAVTNLFASYEVRHSAGEQTRSKAKVKVKAKNLTAGDYYAVITSGDNSVQSETKTISGDELEIEFDSDSDDILEGAEAIEAGFVTDNTVLAELFDASTDELVLSESVSCLVKN